MKREDKSWGSRRRGRNWRRRVAQRRTTAAVKELIDELEGVELELGSDSGLGFVDSDSRS